MAPFLAVSCCPGTGIPGVGGWSLAQSAHQVWQGRVCRAVSKVHTARHVPAWDLPGAESQLPVSLLTREVVGQRPEQVQPQNVSSGVTSGAKKCILKRRGENPVKFLEELPLLC